jgi:hypothetical protein
MQDFTDPAGNILASISIEVDLSVIFIFRCETFYPHVTVNRE